MTPCHNNVNTDEGKVNLSEECKKLISKLQKQGINVTMCKRPMIKMEQN